MHSFKDTDTCTVHFHRYQKYSRAIRQRRRFFTQIHGNATIFSGRLPGGKTLFDLNCIDILVCVEIPLLLSLMISNYILIITIIIYVVTIPVQNDIFI